MSVNEVFGDLESIGCCVAPISPDTPCPDGCPAECKAKIPTRDEWPVSGNRRNGSTDCFWPWAVRQHSHCGARQIRHGESTSKTTPKQVGGHQYVVGPLRASWRWPSSRCGEIRCGEGPRCPSSGQRS